MVNFFNQPDSNTWLGLSAFPSQTLTLPFKPPTLICLPSLNTHTLAVHPHYQKPEAQDHKCMLISSTDGVPASFVSPWLWLSTVSGCGYTALWGLRKRRTQQSCQYFKQTSYGNGTRLLSPSFPGTQLSTILCSSTVKALELPPLICYFSNLVETPDN